MSLFFSVIDWQSPELDSQGKHNLNVFMTIEIKVLILFSLARKQNHYSIVQNRVV